MIFAPAIGFAILFIIIIRLLALCSLAYIFRLLLNCVRKPGYFALLKKKPTILFIKIGIALVFITLGILEYVSTSRAILETENEIIARDKKLNPVLEKDSSINGFLLPKGTKLERYNSEKNTFLSATFPSSFTFKGLEITWIQNPNDNNATIKLYKSDYIDGFKCEKDTKLYVNFDENNMWVKDCVLANNQSYKGIKWSQGTTVDTSKQKIVMIGNAEFTLQQTSYNQYLHYTYDRLNDTAVYKDKAEKVVFRNDAGYKTVSEKDGTYSIQFRSLLKNMHYKITNRATGEEIFGKTDTNGVSIKVITTEPTIFDFEYVFTRVK